MNITDISGIGDATAQLLKTHGIDSVEALAQASIEQLAAVPGIGANRAAALGESARRLLPAASADTPSSETVPAPAGDDTEMERTKDGKGKKKEKEKEKEQGQEEDKEERRKEEGQGAQEEEKQTKIGATIAGVFAAARLGRRSPGRSRPFRANPLPGRMPPRNRPAGGPTRGRIRDWSRNPWGLDRTRAPAAVSRTYMRTDRVGSGPRRRRPRTSSTSGTQAGTAGCDALRYGLQRSDTDGGSAVDWMLRELASSTETLSAFLTPDLARIGEPDIVARLVLQVLLLFASAYFSGSETALFSLSRLDLQKLRRERNRHSDALHELLDHPRRLIISILCGNEFVNIASAANMAGILVVLFGPERAGIVTVLVMIPLLLLLGEVTPKTIAVSSPVTVSTRIVAAPMTLWVRTVIPLVWAIRGASDRLTTAIVGEEKAAENILHVDEFRTLVETSAEEGELNATELGAHLQPAGGGRHRDRGDHDAPHPHELHRGVARH